MARFSRLVLRETPDGAKTTRHRSITTLCPIWGRLSIMPSPIGIAGPVRGTGHLLLNGRFLLGRGARFRRRGAGGRHRAGGWRRGRRRARRAIEAHGHRRELVVEALDDLVADI